MAKYKARELYRSFMAEGCPNRCREDIERTKTYQHIAEAVQLTAHGKPGGLDFTEFSIRDLFANLVTNRSDGQPVGESFVQEMLNPRNQADWTRIAETGSSGAVNYAMFAGITGQLLITRFLDQYRSEDFVATKLVPTQPSPFESERWPGVALPKDPDYDTLEDTVEIAEGQDYPTVGFGEEYIQTATTRKHGLKIPVTREAIFFDRTGLISRNAAQVGYLLGLRKEKRILSCMIGGKYAPLFTEKRQFDSAPVSIDIFQAAGGTALTQLTGATYASRPFPFVNDVPANAFVDYTSIRTAEQYFSRTIDPSTGEPVVIGKPFLFLCKTRELDIKQVLLGENIYKNTQYGLATAGALTYATSPIMTHGASPIRELLSATDYRVSRQLRRQLVLFLQTTAGGGLSASDADAASDKIWFYGDPAAAFAYMENWPITVTQAPTNIETEFNRDIVLQFKATERGVCTPIEPRCWQRHNFLSTAS